MAKICKDNIIHNCLLEYFSKFTKKAEVLIKIFRFFVVLFKICIYICSQYELIDIKYADI